jgi:hypothetical protein
LARIDAGDGASLQCTGPPVGNVPMRRTGAGRLGWLRTMVCRRRSGEAMTRQRAADSIGNSSKRETARGKSTREVSLWFSLTRVVVVTNAA